MVKHAAEHPGASAGANGHLGESRESMIQLMNLLLSLYKVTPEGHGTDS